MKRLTALVGGLILAVPILALAHVTVRPRESKPAADERYTLRVPTEGTVATTSVRLEVPDGVTVLEVEPPDGASFAIHKDGDRIVSITWTTNIPPKQAAEFFFRATNPATGADLPWKAHQHFADGTVTDWVGPAGTRRPASVTRLQ